MKTKKLLSFMLAIVMVVSMMTTLSITASAKPATDQYIKVGETQVIRAEGIYSSETTDGNYYYVSVVDGSTQSVPKNNISIESVDQDGNEMVITIKGVAVTDEDETVGIVAKVYREEESYWVDAAIQCGYHVVSAEDAEYLDLDENTTEILDSKDLDQNYNLKVTESVSKANEVVTKVKLSWEISDINATRTDDMVWDTEELCWKADSSTATINKNGTAKFTLENYSSVKVDAKVTFDTAEYATGKKFTAPTLTFDEDEDATTKDDGKITLDTANGNDTYSKENPPKGEIDVTVTPVADDFKTLTETTTAKKYGIYTVTISQVKESVTLTFNGSNSHSTLSYNGTQYAYGESFSFSVPKNSTISITGAGTSVSTLTVDGKTVTQTASGGWPALWSDVSDGTKITESMTINSSSCILSGSKVTLADGSVKLIDDVTTEDKLMTFNFYEGKLDGNYPMYVMKHEDVLANVITVTLDNGTVLEMCDWQQFFDMNKKTYFDIDAANYRDSIGKNILFVEKGEATTAKITNATMKVRTCTSYEIFTEYNKNFVANGILTVEPETYLQGVYTIGDDLKIDVKQYQKDVDTYGRYTYGDFADIMTKHEFDVMNIADKKIAVGKGIVSEEWLFALYERWTPIYR